MSGIHNSEMFVNIQNDTFEEDSDGSLLDSLNSSNIDDSQIIVTNNKVAPVNFESNDKAPSFMKKKTQILKSHTKFDK